MNAENSQELLEEKTGTATDAHAAKVSGLFARIVKWYDPLNRLLSLGLDQGWRKCLADAVLPGQAEGKRVLDLAAGTLDVTLAVRKRHPAAQVLAMDFCPPMLVHGQKKLSGEDKDFVLSVGADARALPLPDACMDGLTMAFGIRNIAPRFSLLRGDGARPSSPEAGPVSWNLGRERRVSGSASTISI